MFFLLKREESNLYSGNPCHYSFHYQMSPRLSCTSLRTFVDSFVCGLDCILTILKSCKQLITILALILLTSCFFNLTHDLVV